MIINTGCRTDIPAYYSKWFFNRIREGYVLVRNPYRENQVIKYRLTPDVVDVICFCTKNPEPMLENLHLLSPFRQFWFVTITPYGKDIEPNVPEQDRVINSVKKLSERVGARAVSWRYDPIFINNKYSVDFHIQKFTEMAEELKNYVNSCVVSFIDLYFKTKRNFPGVREVSPVQQEEIIRAFASIGRENGIKVRTCCENPSLEKFGVDVSGCMTQSVIEKATGCSLNVPKAKKAPRAQCNCLLGCDIGMYNTCGHGCIYCYANYDMQTVAKNMACHYHDSPLLIGRLRPGDKITEARQISYIDDQINIFEI